MRQRVLPILLPFLLALPSAAVAADNHVALRDYVENQVVRFAAHPGFQSTIQFADGERIENIAVGESGAWQVTPNRRANLIFIKPMGVAAPVTNMTVVTDRHTYLFELHPAARATPLYLLRFIYPEDLVPPPVAVPEEAEAPRAIPVALPAQALPVNDLNFAWSMKGDRALLPERVFDDGHSVYLAWAEGRALPAILSIGPDGKTEGPVNFSANGQYLVVAGFHSCLILRTGKALATLETARPAPAPLPATATALAQTK